MTFAFISIFQAATQINEQTLTFVPKIVLVLGTFAVFRQDAYFGDGPGLVAIAERGAGRFYYHLLYLPIAALFATSASHPSSRIAPPSSPAAFSVNQSLLIDTVESRSQTAPPSPSARF